MVEKVLIVDDDVQTLRLIGLMLERQGYKIVAASNGAQALQLALSELPDLIILDVMMPEMDGYETTRQLRKDPETTNIPILLFTAKTQVDDKIIGYEAGADDYLTKPVHPAELTAHVRALLSRRKTPGATSNEKGYTIGVMSAKGGIGVSSLALNLAIAFHQRTKSEVVAAELRPGQGIWGIEFGDNDADGLCKLLSLPPADISVETVEKELTHTPYGVRLLMASPQTKKTDLMQAAAQTEAVVETLQLLARLVLLDIGTNYMPCLNNILERCDELLLVIEPIPACVQRTKLLLEDLKGKGFGNSKLLTLVSINRIRADAQLSIMHIQETLGIPVAQVIPPAPEIAFQAATRNIPLIQVQVGSAVSTQYNNLAERLAQRIPL